MEFTTEFLQTTCLGASIYRLQEFKFASDLNYLAGIQTVAEGVRTDNYATSFPNSYNILSRIGPRPNSVALPSGRLHFSCTQFPCQGYERSDHEVWCPDGWTDARNFHIWGLSVRTMKSDVRMFELCMQDLTYQG